MVIYVDIDETICNTEESKNNARDYSFSEPIKENIEKINININLKNYYDILNDTLFSCVHYLNYFEHTEAYIGNASKPSEINKIRSVALLDMKKLEEKWLFDLDAERELCYYMCINEERLEEEAGLHKKLVDILQQKNRKKAKKDILKR